MSRQEIEHFHKHIDNGGISVDIDYDFDDGHVVLSLGTSYHGYPEVGATLKTWGEIDAPKFLEQLGLMFLRASAKSKVLIDAEYKKRGLI